MRVICEFREHIVQDDQRRGHVRIPICEECKRLQARRWLVVRVTDLGPPMIGRREEIMAECRNDEGARTIAGALAGLLGYRDDDWFVEGPDGGRWKLLPDPRRRRPKKRRR